MDCKEGNEYILRQIDDLLLQVDREIYARPLDLFQGATIGQHIRHILNFYQALLRGADKGLIDYADRERDLQIEQDPALARQVFLYISRDIQGLDEERELPVLADFIPDKAVGRPIVQSTLGRELMFAFDHAVHHLAMVRIGLQVSHPDLHLQEELGVAPSTLKFQKEQNSAS